MPAAWTDAKAGGGISTAAERPAVGCQRCQLIPRKRARWEIEGGGGKSPGVSARASDTADTSTAGGGFEAPVLSALSAVVSAAKQPRLAVSARKPGSNTADSVDTR